VKKWGIWGAVFVVALSAAYLAGRTRGGNRDSASSLPGYIGFEPPAIDLGELPWNTIIPFTAVFANGGNSPVLFESVTTSCGCVVISEDYEGATVPPSERITLEGLLDTEYRPGRVARTVTISASCQQTFELELACAVKPTYELSPDGLCFGIEDPSPQSVELASEQGVEFVSVAADEPWLLPSFDGRTLEVAVDWALLSAGEHYGAVNVYTNDRYVPAVRLPVTAQQAPGAYLAAATVYLLDDVRHVVRLRGLEQDSTVAFMSVQALPSGIELELRRTELRLSQPAGPSGLQTPVYVDLSDGSQLAFMLYY